MPEKNKLKSRWTRTASVIAGTVLTAGSILAGTASAWATSSPAELTFSPSTGEFGQVTVGESTSMDFTVTNTGHAASSALSVTLTDSSAFSITSNTCTGISLPKNKSCMITVQFAPASAGTATATLSVTGDNNKPGSTATLAVTGTGVEPSHLYWTTAGNSGSGTIMESNLDGSNAQQIGGGTSPTGVAADSTNVYWGDAAAGTITEANPDGTGAQVIVSGQAPKQIAVDTTNGHLYWANFGSGMFGAGSTIWEANLDGSDAHSIASFTGAQGVAVNGTNLFWTQGYDPYNPSQPYGVIEANLNGSDPQVIAPNLQVFELAADSSHIYWTGHDNSGTATVTEANLDGTSPQIVGTGTHEPYNSIFSGVAVNSTNLYWSDLNNGTVTRAGLTGSDPAAIVTGQQFPLSVAVG